MCKSIAALASMFFGAKLKGEVERAGFEYLGAIGEVGLMKHAKGSSPIAILLDHARDPDGIHGRQPTMHLNEQLHSGANRLPHRPYDGGGLL